MDNEMCFIIDYNKLYLEQILVEYNDVPIYFICKDSKEYYISLCIDIEELYYFVVKVSELDIYNLLHGNLTMRDSIIKQKYYWRIFSADEIENDRVERKCIDDIDLSVLPEEGAYFSILTEEISKYVTEFDTRFLGNGKFTETEQSLSIDESMMLPIYQELVNIVEQYTEICDYQTKQKLTDGLTGKSICYKEDMKDIHNFSVSISGEETLEEYKIVKTNSLVYAA